MKKQKLFRSIGSVQEPLFFPLNDDGDDEEKEEEEDEDDENERHDDYNDDNYMSDDDDENDERGHNLHVPYKKILLWNH